ncbi:Fic family protein [Candidatus Daviesbacteria bacterium]|nr:Fic family protein [Candidatus Daviesbacteria bacterium]
MNTLILRPFSKGFLSQFVWIPKIQPFTNKEILSLDRELSEYEQVFLNPDIERNLISKNELLASFAISKAEDSHLTLPEAQDVYNLLISDPDYDFVAKLLKARVKLTQKDYDQLEFFNIAKTFRNLNQQPIKIAELTPEKIKKLHQNLTQGLDLFQKYLSDFTVYRSGKWRDNNMIRVGSYTPAPYEEIESGVKELIDWLQKHQTVDGVAIFHTALYGLHAFNNGNKRVCRSLEHVLLRSLGINGKNLYSTSYYYHKQKARYYKYLLYSLERKNLNHFVNFVLEALVLSIIGVVKTSLETKRNEFIGRLELELEGQIPVVLKPFIKRSEIQFKNLAKATRGKIARQTLVTYLQRAVDQDILKKREAGRSTYYTLNFASPELDTFKKWLGFAGKRLVYIPDNMKLV